MVPEICDFPLRLPTQNVGLPQRAFQSSIGSMLPAAIDWLEPDKGVAAGAKTRADLLAMQEELGIDLS